MKRSGFFRTSLALACCAVGAACASNASAHVGFDIMPYYDASHNEIAIGGVTHATTTNPVNGDSAPTGTKFRIDQWDVFAYEFDSTLIPGFTNGLGVNNEPGTYTDLSTDPSTTVVVPVGNPTGFNVGDVIFFQATTGLQQWDDSVEAFVTAAAGTSISVDDGSIVVDGSGFTNNESFPGVGVGGFLSQVGANGFHSHFGSQMSNPSLVGIYAFQVQANLYGYDTGTDSVFDKSVASDPFWLVYNSNDDDGLFDEAIHFLSGDDHDHDHDDDDHHGFSAVPEPASASLLALGLVAMAYRRRK